MPIRPFRFVHACNLLLDHRLSGVDGLADSVRELADESTFSAFDQIVDTCLKEHVDFLLLGGNSFDETDHSLRSQVVLVEGLRRLEEAGISVFIAPGTTDPPAAWESFAELPENTRFVLPGAEPHVAVRDGEPLATITGTLPPQRVADTPNDSPADLSAKPITIALLHTHLFPHRQEGEDHAEADRDAAAIWHDDLSSRDVRYWALGAGAERKSTFAKAAIAHHPGACQAMQGETGPHGCTIVDVDERGVFALSFIPTAPIRLESVKLTVDDECDLDRLLVQMREALHVIHRHPTDRVWLVSWDIRAERPLVDALRAEGMPQEIEAALQQEFAQSDVVLKIGRMSVREAVASDRDDVAAGELADEFSDLLTGALSEAFDLPAVVDESYAAGSPWAGPLHEIAEVLDRREVFRRARELGREWFADDAEGAA